ncbi:probable calcium-binding protein CML49 [Malus domestica]|uniref:probable calcium-binding protein CML49 n=1 Tax=Malus domestica TaxID=3750 RepID=UPI0039751B68
MNSDGKPQSLYLRPYKGTYLGSFCSASSDNQKYNGYNTSANNKTDIVYSSTGLPTPSSRLRLRKHSARSTLRRSPPPPQGQHQHQTAQPYGAPSAPYGAPPSAPYGAPYAPEKPYKPDKPYNPDKPHKNQGGGGGYPAPGPGYGSPFAALVPSVFPPGTDPNVIACF